MKNGRIRKILSLLLCAVLVIGMVPVSARAEAPATLYLTPGSDWAQANARFAAYFFGDGDTWGDMTDADGDGTYEVAVPSGYTSVIFVRMNPATTVNSWDSKWDQTVDLTVPTDGTNCFTIESPWDSGGATGSWSTYTYVEPVFIIAGSEGLCGTAWDTANTDNQMTQNSEGLYEKTYENVAVGTYALKVTHNGSWYGNSDGSDVAVEVTEEGSTVTVTFDAATKAVTVTVTAPEVGDTTATITGVSITVDDVTYTEGNVTVTPASTVSLGVIGTNLQNGTEDNSICYAPDGYVSVTPDIFDVSPDGTTAVVEAPANIFESCIYFEVAYCNDVTGDLNIISTGIFVTYDGGTDEGGDDTTVDVDLSDGIINDVAELKAALQAGGEYTLGNDITLMEIVDVYADTVLDLGGYTITMEYDPEGYPWGRISVADPSETPSPCALTLKNGSVAGDAGDISLYRGSLTVESGSYEYITVFADEGEAVLNLNGGTVGTVDVTQYEGATARVNLNAAATVQEWKIEGGTFNFDPTDHLYTGYQAVEADDLWTVELDTASVTPTGETFRVYFNNWLDAPEYGYVGYYFYVENSEDPMDLSTSVEDIVVELSDFKDENGDCLTFPMTRSTEDDKVWYVDLDTAYQNARFDFYSESGGGSTFTMALPRQDSMIYDPTDDAWSAYTPSGSEEPEVTTDLVVTTEVADGYTYTDGVLTFTKGGDYTVSMNTDITATDDIIVVNAQNVNLTLDNVTINAPDGGYEEAGKTALTLNHAASLILVGTNALTGGNGGNSTTHSAGHGGHGISGTVTLSGATLTVTGGNGGIGESLESEGGNGGSGIYGAVTVSGGTLTATGGNGGSGYYAGNGGNGISGAVTVGGGTLTATGGNGGGGVYEDGTAGKALGSTIAAEEGYVLTVKAGADAASAVVVETYNGEKYAQVTAAAQEPALYTLHGANVELGDSLTMYFYVDKDALSEDGDYSATIVRTYADGTPENTLTIPFNDWTDYNGELYRFAYTDLPARAMADEMTVTIYNGETQFSEVWEDSIQKYGMRMLEQYPNDEKLRTTVVDMLNYGAEAQLYFAYNTGDLANALLSDAQKGYATQTAPYPTDNAVTEITGDYKGSTISLKNKLMLTFYFDGLDVSDKSVTATITYTKYNGETVTQNGEFYLPEGSTLVGVDAVGISAANCMQDVTCTVSKDGEVIATATDSVAKYLSRMQGEEAGVYSAAMKFLSSAKDYFISQLGE